MASEGACALLRAIIILAETQGLPNSGCCFTRWSEGMTRKIIEKEGKDGKIFPLK